MILLVNKGPSSIHFVNCPGHWLQGAPSSCKHRREQFGACKAVGFKIVKAEASICT